MEEINQNQLNGNQNYENGDIDMEAGFEGMSKLSVYWVKNIYIFCNPFAIMAFFHEISVSLSQ